MSGESVKVAVRVRPFNSREKDRGAKCCLDMMGALTQIRDPEAGAGAPPKDFTFDFSYWSHDGWKEDENGYLHPANDKYADQRKVFDDLGAGVLKNAFEGFNCSLFAYGQTGAGKSYSMVGYGVNKGIVPITCDELFKRIESNTDTTVKFQVTFSMLEIYNEQVRDLLSKDNPKGGLQIRQNPKENSFYVQGLKKVAVGSYKEIETRTDEGTSNRTVAATQMNATSSRAHTVVTIQFEQISKNESGQETKKSSIINLVDLAGSERADSTGATGDRLKEGANINKSLSALGNVISSLADLSMGKKKVLVPYRDSALTKLLQNALGGNSKTIMIAALSPADINYDETLGTLRYADRAKKIKNKAVVNENPMDKLIRELKEENDKLKKALDTGSLGMVAGGGNLSPEEIEKMRKEMEEQIRAQLEANMDSMMSWDEKLQVSRTENASSDSSEKEQKLNTIPHIVNLNEDSLLSGVVIHFLDKEEVTVGNKKGDPPPSILLSGLSIQKQHAVITVKESEITIKPATTGSKTKVNGMPLTGETPLKHMDRILFGSNHMYYLKNPKNTEKSEGSPDKVDWDFAQKEIAEAKGFATAFGSGLSKEQQLAQEQVLELLPLVSEVNAVSEELDKGKTFEVILISGAAQGNTTSGTKVAVKMKSMLNGNVWLWDRGKFMNRRFLIQEMYQKFMDGEDVSKIPKEQDPFWEDVEDVLIGTANLFLQSLGFALDFDDKLTVTDYKGSEEATLVVNVTPCTQTGKPLDEDNFVENPSELLDKPYHFKVTIRTGEIHKSRFSKGIYVKYKTKADEEYTVTDTKVNTLSPEFNNTKIFSIPKVTQETLEWFDSGCITFLMYGRQEDSVADPKLSKMTTKELRQMEQIKASPGMGPRSMTIVGGDVDSAQLKAELVLMKRKNERLIKKEKRIQDLCEEWGKKPPAEQQFDAFHRAISAAANYQSGRLKYRIHMLTTVLKAQKGVTANGGELKLDQKQPPGSRACNLM
ncbi:kinesin-like protein KIF28P [Actinia tenebrosa]|uniref:Kinesin-like protein 6 n=1 Tax=Actinia tenebrosa TaxID=6105 RepID=A0A6P8HHG7_ACTTE|nr:kinesin-like protein KIF28P [Actinia tenebrosa]